MTTSLKTALAPRPVRALRHWVPVQREAVLHDVDVARTVEGVPSMQEGAKLGLKGRRGAQQVWRGEGGGRQAARAVMAPHRAALIAQTCVPASTHEGTRAQVGQGDVGEEHVEDGPGQGGPVDAALGRAGHESEHVISLQRPCTHQLTMVRGTEY